MKRPRLTRLIQLPQVLVFEVLLLALGKVAADAFHGDLLLAGPDALEDGARLREDGVTDQALGIRVGGGRPGRRRRLLVSIHEM